MIIDPIVAYTGDKVDMYRANHVRKMMKGLAALAEAHRLRHRHRSALQEGGRRARFSHQGAGSVDFTAAVHSVLIIAADPDDDERRVIAIPSATSPRRGRASPLRSAATASSGSASAQEGR